MMGEQQARLDRLTEVRFLRGVGPQRAEYLAQLGVRTVGDLLEYYPRSYEFLPPVSAMDEVEAEQRVAVWGQVSNLRYRVGSRPPRFELVLRDGTGEIRLVWFHGGYLRDRIMPGDVIAAWGKVSRYKETLQIINPRWTKLESEKQLQQLQETGEAIYPAGGNLSSGEISRVIRDSLEQLLDLVEERYGADYRAKRNLPSRREALGWIHRPADQDQVDRARRRLAYDELFLMELGIALRRERLRRLQPAYALEINDLLDSRIRRLFPFVLTAAQERVIAEIRQDMARGEPMNRLLQGDVGSGKTVVALYAALLAVGHHHQVALMAPTEILAEQHVESLERYLSKSRVRRLFLTGGLTGKKRAEAIKRISQGEVDIVVGTQALLESDVLFGRLALVIIDEQHKFGVRQRAVIRGKDVAPHYLVMTATPIPRTLAMTVFGDLEISTIDELPPGRGEVITRWVAPEKLPQAYEFIRTKVSQAEQAYFVYPRVEEAVDGSANSNSSEGEGGTDASGRIKAAIAEREYLQREVFPEFTVGLLHGQMDRAEKYRVMEKFRTGGLHILVATVVIEVGVDVPNATIMVIEHAERFGLAQLHQLRGRIGRGGKQSYCLLFGRPKTDAARRRLEIMVETNDGFKIAEEDLRVRGPGEFFGAAQHGLPELKIADLVADLDLLRLARRDAFAVAKSDLTLEGKEHAALRRALQEQFGDDLGLADVG